MKILFKLILPFFLYSCASERVDYHIPSSLFISPETKGEALKGSVVLGGGRSNKVIIAESFQTDFIINSSPNINTNKKFKKSIKPMSKLELAVWKRVDLYYRRPSESAGVFGFNFQFFGKPEKELQNGWKLSTGMGYGESTQKESNFTMQSSNLNSKLEDIDASIDVKSKEFFLNVGHRINDSYLIYLSNFYYEFSVSGKMDIGNLSYGLSDTVRGFGSNLGVRYSYYGTEHLGYFTNFEIGHNKIEHHSIDQVQDGTTVNLGIGVLW